MTEAITNVERVMNSIDLGPSGSVGMMFAKLQLAQSQLCKLQAEDYMDQIEKTQQKQQEAAEMIERARALQNQADESKKCTTMPDDMIKWCNDNGIPIDTHGNSDKLHNADEWDYNIQGMQNYQEKIGNETQTQMVFLQDFIGQYNSFLQGANAAISQANQTLTAVATGR